MKTHENIMFWFVRIVKQSDLSPDSIEIPCPMSQVAPSHLALSLTTQLKLIQTQIKYIQSRAFSSSRSINIQIFESLFSFVRAAAIIDCKIEQVES